MKKRKWNFIIIYIIIYIIIRNILTRNGTSKENKTETDDIDDIGGNSPSRKRNSPPRKRNVPRRAKKIPRTLDNRYTDVVSLQCKVHESTRTNNLIINH